MKKNKILVFLLAAVSATAIGAAACKKGGGGNGKHNHSYSWHSDADGHWEECESGDDTKTKADHVDLVNNETEAGVPDGKCDVCGRTNNVVTFNVQGHGMDNVPAAQIVYEGGKAVNPGTIVAEDLIFSGWYKDEACTTEFDFEGTVISAPTTIYAKWSVEVTFDTGDHGVAPETQTVKLGGTVTKPTDPEYGEDGYVFDYWYVDDESVPYEFTTPVTAKFTLHAHWTTDTRPLVTFDLGAEGKNATYETQRVAEGGYATKPATDPELDGYFFAGWYDEEGTEFNFEETVINADTKIVAHWTVDERIIIKFDVQGIGTAPATQKLEEGQKPTKPADPMATGFTFAGWYTTAECDGEEFDFEADVTESTTLYAKWTVTFTFDVQGHGTAPEVQNVKVGGYATKPADLAKDGNFEFGGWYKDADCTEEFNFTTDTVSVATTVYAKWTFVYPQLTLEDETLAEIGEETELRFQYKATEDGRYRLELAMGVSENLCTFTTDLAEDDGVLYGAGCDLESKTFDLHAGDVILVTIYRGEGVENSAMLGMFFTQVTDEELPEEGWLSGKYTNGTNYTITFDRDTKAVTYNNWGYEAKYLGGSFNYLYFSSSSSSGGTVTNYTIKETAEKTFLLTIQVGTNTPTRVTLTYVEPQRPMTVNEFEGTYTGSGSIGNDGNPITQIIIYENGNGKIKTSKNEYTYTLGSNGCSYDRSSNTLYWGNYYITANLGEEDTVVSINVEYAINSNIAVYTRTGNAPEELPEFIPVDSLVNYVGEHFVYYFNNYASIIYDLDPIYGGFNLTEVVSKGRYKASYSLYGQEVNVEVEVIGSAGDYTIKIYQGGALFDTLKPLVEHSVPADGEEVTLNASEFVLGRYYYMRTTKAANYNITFTGVDNIILKTEAMNDYIVGFDGSDFYSGDKAKLKANSLIAIDIGQVWGPKPESITVKFEEVQAEVGESADNPKIVDMNGWTFNAADEATYYAEFTAPSAGTYKFAFSYDDGSSRDIYMITYRLNGTLYGYLFDWNDWANSGWKGGLSESNHYAQLTLTEGQTVKIELDAQGWGYSHKLEIIKA